MATERISCRIDSGKLAKLVKLYPNWTVTAVIETAIDRLLPKGIDLSYTSDKPSPELLEQARLLKNEYNRNWKRSHLESVKAQRVRYWVKKARQS